MNEQELIEEKAKDNEEVKNLWQEHQLFGKKIEKLESKSFLTPDEEVELKSLKVQKLEGKTRLYALIESI